MHVLDFRPVHLGPMKRNNLIYAVLQHYFHFISALIILKTA